jgi:hypothetical protein
MIILSSCSYKVQTKTIVLKDNNNQPYTKIIKILNQEKNVSSYKKEFRLEPTKNLFLANKNEYIELGKKYEESYDFNPFTDYMDVGEILGLIGLIFLLCLIIAFVGILFETKLSDINFTPGTIMIISLILIFTALLIYFTHKFIKDH